MAVQWWKIETFHVSVDQILERFAKAYRESGGPARAAVFSDPGVKQLATHFFSPNAAEIAPSLLKAHGAQPCEKPAEANFCFGKDEDKDMVPRPSR
jgi:hypothetical protein